MNNELNFVYKENKCCLACGCNNLKIILDLGDQPLANNYHNNEKQEKYPLKLNLCNVCYHLQLSHIVNPDLMFKHYLYVSGTSQTLKDYFDFFSKKTLEYTPNARTVLDIACNDGTQLDSYKILGLETYGIDPAKNLYKDSVNKGHNIICDYFNESTIYNFSNKKFDIITAQNVLAHTEYARNFLESCKLIMKEDSILFVQTSQSNMIENNEFDTIYHEHVSFFNTNSMKNLVERSGLVLNDVFKTDIHGGSYVFVITKKQLKLESNNVLEQLQIEKQNGLYDVTTYLNYALKCYNSAISLKTQIQELKNKDYIIIGYGAAAKGNTLLNFSNIFLDKIIDDNPLKQNLFTPGMNIPIVNSDILLTINVNHKIAFIPLAWNFYKEIKERIKKKRNNNNDLFVKYFPTINIER